jgi:hypothetical protein
MHRVPARKALKPDSRDRPNPKDRRSDRDKSTISLMFKLAFERRTKTAEWHIKKSVKPRLLPQRNDPTYIREDTSPGRKTENK